MTVTDLFGKGIQTIGQAAVVTDTVTALNGTSAVLAAVDCLTYQSISIQVIGTWVGTLQFQVSNDNVNWTGKILINQGASQAAAITSNGMLFGDLGARYFRAIFTAWTSGTAQIIANLSAFSYAPPSNNLNITNVSALIPGTGASNLGKAEDAVHTSGDVGVMSLGVRNDNAATVETSTNGDYAALAVDQYGVMYTKTSPLDTAGVPIFTTPTASSQQMVGTNLTRRSAILTNKSNVEVLVRIGAAVTTALYSFPLAAGEKLVMDGSITGSINIITAATGTITGSMIVQEFSD